MPELLNEAEIQLLASLHALEVKNRAADAAGLDERGEGYWMYREDWSSAAPALLDKGLIARDGETLRLTDSGRAPARECHAERPDYYWYYFQQFYRRAHLSAAHSRFCEQVYGLDLCQEGMLDMDALHDLIGRLNLDAGQQLLDLGCGAGGISEYISDRCDAIVTGIDYSKTAIATARHRCRDKASRLCFIEGDLNHLDLEPGRYDAAIAIDSIYWVSDPGETLKAILQALRPGGLLLIIIVHTPQQAEPLELDQTDLAKAIMRLEVDFEAVDCSAAFADFWPRIDKTLAVLAGEFEREGNLFIHRNWKREAESEFLPALAARRLRRYLYQIRA